MRFAAASLSRDTLCSGLFTVGRVLATEKSPTRTSTAPGSDLIRSPSKPASIVAVWALFDFGYPFKEVDTIFRRVFGD